LLGLAVLASAGLLAYALSAAEPKPAAEGAEEKEEKFDYTIEGATKHGTRKVVTLDLGGGVTMEFVRIPHGAFLMGSPDSDPYAIDGEKPQHEVEITKDFYMGKFLVTKKQFARFVEAAKYKTQAETDGNGGIGFDGTDFTRDPKYTWRDAGISQTDDHPVVNVTWNDATEFCKWASGATKQRVVLPTEAQWEYACRAGTTTRYFTGDKATSLDGSANVADRSVKKQFPALPIVDIDDGYVFTSPVGKFRPNPFGLYDMAGNAWEWCVDYYDGKYYKNSDKKDPVNRDDKGYSRVLRGGSYLSEYKGCRSAERLLHAPRDNADNFGFRVAVYLD
jgi:formylglycine-generating enzyme required for sulfatase activity